MSESRTVVATSHRAGANQEATAEEARRPPVVGIVDDDAAVRNALRLLLESYGVRVVTYGSAKEFLAAPADAAVDCLVIDQHMPACTGLELLGLLRRRRQDIPVALMTGAPTIGLVERAAQLNAAHVWQKPLDYEALLTFITSARPPSGVMPYGQVPSGRA